MKRSSIDMTQGPILSNMIKFAIPIMLGSLLQMCFNAADLIVVGRYCGSNSVAAVGATGAISNLMVNLFVGLSLGGGVAVANAVGAKDDDTVYKTVHTAMLTAVLSGIILTVLGVPLSGALLRLMDTPEDILPLSKVYMQIHFAGSVPMLVYNYGASILRAAGESKKPLYFLTAAGVVNVLLNLFFVLVLDMNVAGVSLATTIAQTLSAFLVVRCMLRRTDSCRLEIKDLHIHKEPFLKILRIGIPSGIQGSLFSISNVLIQSSFNSLGTVVMKAQAAGQNINSFMGVIINAISSAVVNFCGQNMGARNYERVKKVIYIGIAAGFVLGNVLGVTTYFLGKPLLGIYITDSPEAIEIGMRRLMLMSLPYFTYGLNDAMSGALRGIGKSSAAMLTNVFGICIYRIGWVYTVFRIPRFHTADSLFISYPISWILTFFIMYIWFYFNWDKVVLKEEQRYIAAKVGEAPDET
ncbi:MAG: MATE family efflux transporter [Clostridia bacterium]|nr:MATE family efflux transporter [Clostridia bacterium]